MTIVKTSRGTIVIENVSSVQVVNDPNTGDQKYFFVRFLGDTSVMTLPLAEGRRLVDWMNRSALLDTTEEQGND